MFKEFIADSILNYPSLFLKDTYEMSEMSVLCHVFFTIGNGYTWKDGFPLCGVGADDIGTMPEVDIKYFFDIKDKLYLLEVSNKETEDYVRGMTVPFLKEYSNGRVLYVMDEKFVKSYNNQWKKDFPNIGGVDLFERVSKFEKVSRIWTHNMVSLYPICDMSAITEMLDMDNVKPETMEYARKMLDYAERYYHGEFGPPDNDIKEELKKIHILRGGFELMERNGKCRN